MVFPSAVIAYEGYAMRFDPEKHHRKTIRMQGYDYSQPGAYFVTIVTQGRACLFGEIVGGEMRLNEIGEMIAEEWDALRERFPQIVPDVFIVMPNHIHGIIVITDHLPDSLVSRATISGATTRVAPTSPGATIVGAGLVPAPDKSGLVPAPDGATTRVAPTRGAPTVGDMVGAFKSRTTVRYIEGVKTRGWPPFHRRLWQRNYYEHIIRNEDALQQIRQYILDNPANWENDRENPLQAQQ